MVDLLIEELVASLKQEEVYKTYLNAKQELDKYSDLMWTFKEVKEEYIKMKPYFKYQDFSELQERFMTLSNQVTNLEAYQVYMKANHALQERLNEVGLTIFGDIIEKTEGSVCESSQENINEEI